MYITQYTLEFMTELHVGSENYSGGSGVAKRAKKSVNSITALHYIDCLCQACTIFQVLDRCHEDAEQSIAIDPPRTQ